MANHVSLEKQHKILQSLHCIPKKMVGLHNHPTYEHDNLSEFVLYDICSKECFDIVKAAYFINNPDFACLKGVAGICQQESGFCQGISNVWQQPEKYADYMAHSQFNNQVRSIEREHVDESSLQEVVIELANELGIQEPECFLWHMKYGNNGVLLIEHTDHDMDMIKKLLPESVYLLGFCPVH
jgi:hypothetical protein